MTVHAHDRDADSSLVLCDGGDTVKASLIDLAKVEEHGFVIGRWGDGWTLAYTEDPEGYLMIRGHGCIAPRQVDAVIEALHRIDS